MQLVLPIFILFFLLTSSASGVEPFRAEISTDSVFSVKGKSGGSASKGSAKKSPKHTGGPIVDSGPTKGQNRSRNRDGTWRKKRSDAKSP